MRGVTYATAADVQARINRELSAEELARCEVLLQDAATMIDATASAAPIGAKALVSCRMVIRAIGDGEDAGVPLGAQSGTMTALGYSQQWSLPSGSGAGELYIGKAERQLLGVGNRAGAHSPLEPPRRCRHD